MCPARRPLPGHRGCYTSLVSLQRPHSPPRPGFHVFSAGVGGAEPALKTRDAALISGLRRAALGAVRNAEQRGDLAGQQPAGGGRIQNPASVPTHRASEDASVAVLERSRWGHLAGTGRGGESLLRSYSHRDGTTLVGRTAGTEDIGKRSGRRAIAPITPSKPRTAECDPVTETHFRKRAHGAVRNLRHFCRFALVRSVRPPSSEGSWHHARRRGTQR